MADQSGSGETLPSVPAASHSALVGQILGMSASSFMLPIGSDGLLPLVRFTLNQSHESSQQSYGGAFEEILWVIANLTNSMASSLPMLERLKSIRALAVHRDAADACNDLIVRLRSDLEKLQSFYDSIPKEANKSSPLPEQT